ncbi:MAG: hypothetical protein ABL974_09990 [Prosthecobacter sp.]
MAQPADGIRDDTHALSDSSRRLLADEMAVLKKDLGCDVWLSASTFLGAGQTLRNQAREIRQAWSGDADAVLLAYDRATDALSLSFSPVIWKRYPTARLIQLIQKSGRLMTDKTKQPEQRLLESMRGMMSGFRKLERERITSEQTINNEHRRLAMTFSLSLLVGALVLAVLGVLARRRDIHAAWQTHLPMIEVPARLGAPCGGGVTVVWQESH